MTLQQKLKRIGEALAGVVEQTFHYWHPRVTAPYCVWAESGEGDSFHANNRKKEQTIEGFIDYFTLEEFDEAVDSIQTTLNSFDFPFGWHLYSVDYEDETKLIHYSWEFWVA